MKQVVKLTKIKITNVIEILVRIFKFLKDDIAAPLSHTQELPTQVVDHSLWLEFSNVDDRTHSETDIDNKEWLVNSLQIFLFTDLSKDTANNLYIRKHEIM